MYYVHPQCIPRGLMVLHVLCVYHCILRYTMVLDVLCTSDCLLMYPMVLGVLCAAPGGYGVCILMGRIR
jgi:hypothetical protein